MHEYEFSRNLCIVSISNYLRSAAAANRAAHHLVMLFPYAIRGSAEMGFFIFVFNVWLTMGRISIRTTLNFSNRLRCRISFNLLAKLYSIFGSIRTALVELAFHLLKHTRPRTICLVRRATECVGLRAISVRRQIKLIASACSMNTMTAFGEIILLRKKNPEISQTQLKLCVI